PFAVKVGPHEQMLSLRKAEETFAFANLEKKPVPSLLRGFSAPVILDYPYSESDLLELLAHDDDPFNRWEAAQRLAAAAILEHDGVPPASFVEAAREVLHEKDAAFAAEVLTLPSEGFLAEQMAVVDPDRLHAARNTLRRKLADALEGELLDLYRKLTIRE